MTAMKDWIAAVIGFVLYPESSSIQQVNQHHSIYRLSQTYSGYDGTDKDEKSQNLPFSIYVIMVLLIPL
jgi:hypothetical protein